jgi:hypothetical protein
MCPCLDLDIHRSKEIVDVTQESKVGITYCSMVLATNIERMAYGCYSNSCREKIGRRYVA